MLASSIKHALWHVTEVMLLLMASMQRTYSKLLRCRAACQAGK